MNTSNFKSILRYVIKNLQSTNLKQVEFDDLVNDMEANKYDASKVINNVCIYDDRCLINSLLNELHDVVSTIDLLDKASNL